MRIVIIQMCDGKSIYKNILDVTSKSFIKYCDKYVYNYYRWDGIKNGNQPWKAIYNRPYILKEFIEKEEDIDWLCLFDTDVYINCTEDWISKYIKQFSDKALIAHRIRPDPLGDWCISSSGLIFNLNNNLSKEWINSWQVLCENTIKTNYSDVLSDLLTINGEDMLEEHIIGDNHLLHQVIIPTNWSANLGYFSYGEGLFHIDRSTGVRFNKTLEERFEIMYIEVDKIINSEN